VHDRPLAQVGGTTRLDLSRFDAAPLIAFTATKEIDYETETDGFRKDPYLIALTRGLERKQVADDLGVGMLTLNKTSYPAGARFLGS
jgi:hypothetical protein